MMKKHRISSTTSVIALIVAAPQILLADERFNYEVNMFYSSLMDEQRTIRNALDREGLRKDIKKFGEYSKPWTNLEDYFILNHEISGYSHTYYTDYSRSIMDGKTPPRRGVENKFEAFRYYDSS